MALTSKTMHSTLRRISKNYNTGWINIRRYNDLKISNKNNAGSVPEFYRGKCIFITGGTGSIGKLLIEKLFYGCPDIDKIFMLIRADSEKHARKRIQRMIADSSFDRLKKENIESKLVPVLGALGFPGLGISKSDLKKITNEASIIIHLAATIDFNERLQRAMAYNVKGTRDVLKLAKNLKNIEAFVHVSTAYCVARKERKVIQETVYTIPNIESVITSINNNLAECQDQNIDLDILGGAENTYMFTKHLAESLVAEESKNLPVAIVRPSMVSCCLKEPTKGYLNSVNVHSVILYYIANLIPILYGRRENIQDFIPADYVCNSIILAAANAAASKKLMVYNSASTGSNPLLFEHMTSTVRSYFDKPFYPSLFFTESKLMWYIVMYLLRIMPAHVIDKWNRLRGKESRHVRLQKNIISLLSKTNYFYRNSWNIRNENVCRLHSSLSDADKKVFPCDPSDIDWKEYIIMYIQSIHKELKNK